MEHCAVNIKALRERENMTQEELARKLGVKPPAVSKWERALTFPRMDKLIAMANIFGVTVDVILGTEQTTA